MSKIAFPKKISLVLMPRTAGVIFLLLLAFPVMASAQFVNPQFTTVSDGNGGLVVTGFTASGSGLLTIPSTINNLTVTAIGSNAFRSNTLLTGVSIPNTVTSIGLAAFIFTGLTSVTIPDSVTDIQPAAFGGCASLTSIMVSAQNASYSTVNGVLFDKIQSTIVAYPAGVGSSYTIPDSVTSIGNDAFAGSTSLNSVGIPEGVTSIGQEAFEDCPNLPAVTIPERVTSIAEQAFDGCTSLTSVTIPASVTSIGQLAFHGCTDLTNAVFMGNAPTMGSGVFLLAANDFTVSYYDGAIGFTSPTWMANAGNTYPSVDLGPLPPDLFGGTITGTNLKHSPWFGHYNYASYPIIYQFNLGWEYVYDAGNGGGVYLFDYTSGHFWYTQASYFPFIYDFSLGAYLYYYEANTPKRHFYDFVANQVITE